MLLAEFVEFDRKERVRRLRLSVSFPVAILMLLEISVIEIDSASHVTSRRHGNDSGSIRTLQSRPESVRQLKTAEMIGC